MAAEVIRHPSITRPVEPTKATYTVPEAAALLGISEWLGYQLVRQGDWPTRVIRMGRRVVIPKRDVDALLGLDPGS